MSTITKQQVKTMMESLPQYIEDNLQCIVKLEDDNLKLYKRNQVRLNLLDELKNNRHDHYLISSEEEITSEIKEMARNLSQRWKAFLEPIDRVISIEMPYKDIRQMILSVIFHNDKLFYSLNNLKRTKNVK